MAVDRAAFDARFPDFNSAISDKYFDIALNEYECYYSNSCPNDGCNDAAVLQAIAHLITMDSKTSSSAIKDKTSQSADGVAVAFQGNYGDNPSDNQLFWGSTKYGQRFLQLTKGCGYGAFFV